MAGETLADQNNNPLNVKLGPGTLKYVQSGDAVLGPAASDGGRFLSFKSPEAGMGAANDLLFNGPYKDLDLNSAMQKWSNQGYGAEVAPKLKSDAKIGSLGPDDRNYLVSSMAKREGYSGGAFATQTQEPTPQVPGFNDLAKQLDPMMPQADYDALREKYFQDQILPNVRNPMAVPQLWEDFKKGTERQPLLSTVDRMRLRVGLAIQKVSEGVTAPLSVIPGMDSVHQQVQFEGKDLEQLAAREGISTTVPQAIGTLAGMGIPLEKGMQLYGPLAEGLMKTALSNTRTISLASRALRGGLAFATYEAASDQTGNRLMSGLKGFGIGAATDLTLGLPAFLRSRGLVATEEEGAKVVQDMMQGKPAPKEVNEATSEYLQNQEAVTKKEGRPNLFVDPDSKQKGVFAIVEDPTGRSVPVEIPAGKEARAQNQIQQLLDKGGSLDTIQWDADSHGRGTAFLREIADKNNLKYDQSVLVRTNQAKDLVDKLVSKGIPAEQKSNGMVSVPATELQVPPQMKTPSDLPEGVEFIGQQRDADGNVSHDLYNLDIGNGTLKPTFAVKPGEDINAKIQQVRAKFQGAAQTEINAGAQTVADTAKETGQMPKMSFQQAKLLVKRFGGDPEKADIEAIMYMGEPELNRLYETVQKQRAAGVGVENSLAAEKSRLEGPQASSDLEFKPQSNEVNLEEPQELSSDRPDRIRGTTDVPMTEQGKADISAIGDRLVANGGMDTIAASPMERTRGAAQIIADKTGAHIQVDSNLGDIRYGKLEGMLSREAIGEINDRFTNRPNEPFPGIGADGQPGESPNQYKDRLYGAVDKQLADSAANPDQRNMMLLNRRSIKMLQARIGQSMEFDPAVATGLDDGLKPGTAFHMTPDGKMTDLGDLSSGEIPDLRSGLTILRHGETAWNGSLDAKGPLYSTDFKEPSTVQLLGLDPDTYDELNLKVTQRPGQMRVMVPKSVMARVAGNGFNNALTYQSFQDGLSDLGISKADIARLKAPNSPLVILKEGTPLDQLQEQMYHEGIHTNFVNAELNPMQSIDRANRVTVTSIANAIAKYPGYDKMKFDTLVDEAFTYGAQALRFGDDRLLDRLAEWDTSKADVLDFMNNTARNLFAKAAWKLDNPGVLIFRRRLTDLIRRSDESMFKLGQDVDGYALNYEPQTDQWTIPGKQGAKITGSLNDVWNYVLDHDVSDYTSDPSFSAQIRGVRGGLTAGPPPGKNLPLADIPLTKDDNFGWSAISGWFRPFMPWVASLQTKLNPVLEKYGKAFPLYDRVKDVFDAVRNGDDFLTKWTERFGDELSNFSHDKQYNLFNLMTYDRADWGKAAQKLNLSADELQSAGVLAKHLEDFKAETNIDPLTYLTKQYPTLKANAYQVDTVPGWGTLKNPKNQGFWEKAINTAELDPTDEHMGRFLKWTMRQGYGKNFTDAPLKALQDLVDAKTTAGDYVLGATRWPLTNYLNYMKGIPDASAQAINKVMGDFQSFVGKRAEELNKYLPDGMQLPTDFGTPKNAVNRLMLLSYASGLALRPAVAVRDALQVFITGFPVIGAGTFGSGLTKALTRTGWDFAENAGALLKKTNIGEMYGDIFSEMPLPEKGLMDQVSKLSQKLLGPSRWGNNLARATVFNGVFDDAMGALQKFTAGSIDQGTFLRDSHLWFTDEPFYTRMLGRITKEGPTANVAKDIALELVDSTQWAYRRGAQPAMLRTGLGRVLGQYGNWPLNYADFLTRTMRKYSAFPDKALGTAATWAAVNFAASKAMEGLGADSSKWLWTSPASFTGGPQLELIQDLMTSVRSDDEGASARARVLRYPLDFVPGSIAARSIITAMDQNEDMSIFPPGKGLIRALGFKPLADVQSDPDYTAWALRESGITANPYRGRR